MRWSLSIITVVIFLLYSCESSKSHLLAQKDEVHFKRTNLLVADFDRSLVIYRDILGFSIHKLANSGKDSYSYPVFNIPKEAQLRSCTLDSPDQIRTMALTEVKGVALPKLSTSPIMSASVIRVKNLPKVIEQIRNLGLTTTEIEVATGSDGGTFMEQAFIDYDGHLIVVYEYISSK